MHKRAFTLIELLVVIAIIGLLSSVVLASLNSARDRANVSYVTGQLRQLRSAVALYVNDTHQPPPNCSFDCTASTDPFLNALGVSGWNGPYFPGGVWNLEHPWGGQFTVKYDDFDEDGDSEIGFMLDDDAPGTSSVDNSAPIPEDALIAIDRLLDDGNLATGHARGNGLGFLAPVGELSFVPDL